MRFCASQQCAIASGRFSTHAPRSSILRHASVRRPKRAFMPSSCRPYRSAWPRSRNRAAQPVRRTARSPRPGPRRNQSQSAPHQGPVVGGIADESWSATGRFDRAGGAYSGVDGYIGEHQPINPIGSSATSSGRFCNWSPSARARRTSPAHCFCRPRPSIPIAAGSCRSSISTVSLPWSSSPSPAA